MDRELAPALDFLKNSQEGSLATLEDKKPYVSAVGFLYEVDAKTKFGSVLLLLSDLAQHTKNIKIHPQVSLLALEKGNGPVHERRRLTIEGPIELSPKEKFPEVKNKYLRAFPKSEIFFTLADFRFWEISIEKLHWYGGFGKAQVWEK